NWNGYNLNGYITSMKEDGDYIISTHFDLQEKPYRFEAVYKKNKNLIFNGDYGIAGYIQNNKKENIRTFQLISDSIPIPLNEGLLYTELNINGFIKDSEWKVFLNQTKIYSEDIFTLKSPELLVSAELNKDGCDFNNIYYKDKTSALKGSGRLLYKNGIIDSWASIKDESNISNEKYDLFFSKTGENIESRISINSAHLARFTKSGLTGMISANAVFSGSLTEPDLRADIETDQVTFNRIPIKIKSNIKTDKDIIRLSDLELNYNGLMIKRGLVLCELNKGKLLATAGIEQNINGSNVET
ncbi:MAG: hypothetical protein GY756_13155, partial [bacterium]|nr:hypothetical protein [bacterium]